MTETPPQANSEPITAILEPLAKKHNNPLRETILGPEGRIEVSYQDPAHLPQTQINEKGFAVLPHKIKKETRYRMSVPARKVRAILTYNATAGNKTLACHDAGVTRSLFDKWMTVDPIFSEKIREAELEIADRFKHRMAEILGMVDGKNKYSLAGLFRAIKLFAPSMVIEEIPEELEEPPSKIPSPQRSS